MSVKEREQLRTRVRKAENKPEDAYGRDTNELNFEDLAHGVLFDDLGWSTPEDENEDENENENGRDDSSSEDESSSSEDSEERSSSKMESSECSTDEEEDDLGEERAAPRRNEHVEESLDRIHEMMEFIQTYNFEFEKEQLPEEAWDAFTNPPQERVDLSDKQLRRSIQYYLILSHASEETYARFRQLYNDDHPDAPLLSYDQVRRRIRAITGIYPIRVDKCKHNCLAFIGPWGELSSCSNCGEERFDRKGKPRSQFTVIPYAPQAQAQYRHPEWAAKLRYRVQETRRILEEGTRDWSDVLHGEGYLELVESGDIDENSLVLMYSEDSAQLYRDKESSTRFGIGISGDLGPDVRHLENSVIPLFVVGGPKSAQHDSFSLLTLAHLAACQRHGIRVWDCLRDDVVVKRPFLLYALADTVAMTDMSKSVGHHGRNGCRLLCKMPGRHKAGKGIYYPALLRPHGNVPHVPLGSAHPDIDPDSISTPTVEDYEERLERVLSAPNVTQYKKRRKETGIHGPSLFSVLPKALPCPKLFPADLMHLYYNLNQLLLQLWRGSIDYVGNEDPAKWPFAILEDPDTFNALGVAVDRAGRCIPTCVETRIPRNPAEKINT
ncbi:hypothetical protein PQX77_012569 [Marasmius sp. AFHP31]|nr:hypothetical protein PQX77_012569 [Marasmius sp. AFHP31]